MPVQTTETSTALPAARLLRILGATAIALTAANCSQKMSGVDPKYGVAASPRVVKDGDPVPKGGGRQLVGKPYTVAGRTYVPRENPNYVNEGLASWYGANFHGRLTANGEVFDRQSIAAAHTTMPLPSYARVTNVQNGRSIIVRVNDRGPYHGNRIIDVSQRTAEALDFKHMGTARVRVEYVGRASPNGSDDKILLASLRTDGQPAAMPGTTAPTMIAQARPQTNVPRQALALRSFEPDDAGEDTLPAEATAPASTTAPAAARVAAGVPLPPERPFDLGTIPNAATPVPVAGTASGTLPPSRPVMAGLSFAPGASVSASLSHARSFRSVGGQDVVISATR
ncbi:MAG TPA: septal ring lytic transglycosylase RlpA family protein [Microvirga sp.]|jgi:rare lipoprotein A